jgi:peptidoglycan/LPS O-acetylase OafA/YrhL
MVAGVAARPAVGSLVMPPGAFRLLLAVLVVVSHLCRLDIGRLAVLLFFFLSGYWVTKVWDEKFGGREAPRFYAARYLRIAPLYFLCAAASALILWEWPGWPAFTLLGVASSSYQPLGVTWSLDVELQFYLLLPLLAGLFRSPRAALAASFAAGLGGWLLYYATVGFFHRSGGIVTAFQYLPCFALGALTYRLDWRPSERVAVASLGAFAAFTALTCFTPFMDARQTQPFNHDLYGFLWMLPLIPYVARSLAVKSGKLDRHLGNLSYPLYLVHYTLIHAAVVHFGNHPLIKAAAAVLAAVTALAIYWWVDRPVDRWRVRTTERPAVARPAAVAD